MNAIFLNFMNLFSLFKSRLLCVCVFFFAGLLNWSGGQTSSKVSGQSQTDILTTGLFLDWCLIKEKL